MLSKFKANPKGEEIRLLIAKKGYSIKGFSMKLNISYTYLSRIINNRVSITPQMAKRISDALKVNMNDIFLIGVFTNSETEVLYKQ
ncbi:helix-turn-helix domain-containing protein [Lactobacillus sp. S2-2]|uniref:helix-turn-helix domain-containing protein n=1 Tax=Lactobacillus sp. S2-2 TaxID=2692917 RepID=UPI001F472600|nr:helix-turn-helix transcriptional regulator [Lactobacillus sp. S2-2]MCF6515523.1 helix-turn-helix domain-containing protein [Lactobacillus sp. S2-2]